MFLPLRFTGVAPTKLVEDVPQRKSSGEEWEPPCASGETRVELTSGSLAEFVGKRAVEKAASWKSPKGRTFPLRLRILQQRQDFHFSHRPDDGCTFQFP